MAVMSKILSNTLSAQGGINNTLAVADKYCKDALAALEAIREFPREGIPCDGCRKSS